MGSEFRPWDLTPAICKKPSLAYQVPRLNAGWDTDQFLTDVSEATLIMLSVIKNVSAQAILLLFECLVSH